MKRILDISLSMLLIIVFIIPCLIIITLIKFSSKGPVIHWSKRIGKDNIIFEMPKFRTMKIETPDLPTYSLKNPSLWITPIGQFLRKYSLDELPQIYSILKKDMSFVGPRPALHNQEKLIKMRTDNNIHKILPGITGLAQINGRDKLSLDQKLKYEVEYVKSMSFFLDIKIVFKTILIVLRAKNIAH